MLKWRLSYFKFWWSAGLCPCTPHEPGHCFFSLWCWTLDGHVENWSSRCCRCWCTCSDHKQSSPLINLHASDRRGRHLTEAFGKGIVPHNLSEATRVILVSSVFYSLQEIIQVSERESGDQVSRADWASIINWTEGKEECAAMLHRMS